MRSKIKLKIFPVKGSIQTEKKPSPKQENLTTKYLVEQDAENLADSLKKQFEAERVNEKVTGQSSPEAIFGKLLSFLRENNQTTYLVICRKVEKVKIEDNILKLWVSDEKILTDLKSENFKMQIKDFLAGYGLSLGFIDEQKNDVDKKLLKQLLGDKLKII